MLKMFMLGISKEKPQSGSSGQVGTLQDVFLHILNFGSVSVLKDMWGRRNLL